MEPKGFRLKFSTSDTLDMVKIIFVCLTTKRMQIKICEFLFTLPLFKIIVLQLCSFHHIVDFI